jgi:hypothetical protein
MIMKKKALTIVLAVFMALAIYPTSSMAEGTGTVHTVVAWEDPRLGSGMPGVASGDTLLLPTVEAADMVLSVPAGITALTVQGCAVYTNLSIVLDAGHPGLTLNIQDLNMAASSSIDLSGASASSLLIAGSNTIDSRIVVPVGMTLSINGDGLLTANGGIGGGHDGSENGGIVVIYGGRINAQGQNGAAGIGGGSGPARGGDVVIWDGNINAVGDDGGAGIGCGDGTGNPGNVTIHGGTIIANGGAGGAGIGGGDGHGAGGSVTINGGDITAIGGGSRSGNGSCDISGGTITAQGGDGSAGIGSGFKSGSMPLTISGGDITATGGANGAGIGSGIWGGGVALAVSGGRITAIGGTNAQDIGASGLVGGSQGDSGSLTVSGWALITADDTISPTDTNGPYRLSLLTAPGVPAGVRTVIVEADDSSFRFTQNTATDGTLDGIYLAPNMHVSISVTAYNVKTAADTDFGPSVDFSSNSTVAALDIYLSAASGDTAPVVVTLSEENGPAWNQMYLRGKVTSEGGSGVTERGIIYTTVYASSTDSNMVKGGTDVTALAADTGGAGEYRVLVDNLTSNTTYYYRAYAVNSSGITYSAITTMHLQAIHLHISMESGGIIESPDGTEINSNGAIYWNGTQWISNDTAAHIYFSDYRTGGRLTPLSNITVDESGTYGVTNAIGTVAITVTKGSYSYTAEATDGGSYAYSGSEYRIVAAYTDDDAGTTETDNIVLRSKGVGKGTGSAYFDGFLQMADTSLVTAISSDPNWISYPGMTIEQVLAADAGDGTLQGRLVSAPEDYYLDAAGGADMGGRSYIFHTGTFSGVNTDDTSSIYSTGFTLRYHGGDEVVNLNLTPFLNSEERMLPSGGGNNNGNSGGSGGGSTTYTAEVKEGEVKKDTLPVAVDSSGAGTASLEDSKAAALFDARDASVIMPAISGVSAYTLELPVSVLDAGQMNGALTLSTAAGSVNIPDNMLSDLTDTKRKTVAITVARGSNSDLNDSEKAAVGTRPVIKLTLTLDGIQTDWNNPDAPVTVTIPYTATAEEMINQGSVIIWYLDGSGKPVCVPNGHYDAATSIVTFKTNHFSQYAVGYNPVNFSDVSSGVWYHDAVSFIAARGITNGTGGGKFSTDAALTRGQFMALLMRTYGIAPDEEPTDNFIDAGNTYYTNYLAAAKRLGITKGVGGNRFAPDQAISRQEMFVMLYNTLKSLNELPNGISEHSLSDFSDSADIAIWAKDAMTVLVEGGTINGSGSKLKPTAATTRAEMAQVLYCMLEK